MADLVESLVGFHSHSSIASMLLGGSLGGVLGYPVGVIKPGGVVLAVLVGVVGAQGLAEAHLLIGCKKQDINRSRLKLGLTVAGGL